MQTVAVIDYGMGNLHSVAKALEHVGAGRVLITSDANVIREADRVVFPGVGAIRDCMAEIRRLGFDSLVREVSQDRPFLGICVGMQALLDSSEENGGVDCIGLFPGQVKFFGKDLHEQGEHLKVPHMGWNEVQQKVDHPLWHSIPDLARFYFVHSYYISAGNPRQVVGGGHYGVDFAAALAEGSRFAVQFHPEKSHTHGLQLLENFVAWDGRWYWRRASRSCRFSRSPQSKRAKPPAKLNALWKTASNWTWVRLKRLKSLSCSLAKSRRITTIARFSMCRRTSKRGSRASKATCGHLKRNDFRVTDSRI